MIMARRRQCVTIKILVKICMFCIPKNLCSQMMEFKVDKRYIAVTINKNTNNLLSDDNYYFHVTDTIFPLVFRVALNLCLLCLYSSVVSGILALFILQYCESVSMYERLCSPSVLCSSCIESVRNNKANS